MTGPTLFDFAQTQKTTAAENLSRFPSASPSINPPESKPFDLKQTGEVRALTITELTQMIKGTLEPTFKDVWIQGEISNFRPAGSGHLYFSLKDSQSTISAAVFNWGSRKRSYELREGLEVIAHGKISVYPPRGSYQILIDRIEPLGLGALQLAFEQLKEKLQNEGLFDQSKKKQIPRYPNHIAVVTSPTGAAIKDILQVLGRRAPQVKVTILPALVQGDGAAIQITEGIRKAERLLHRPDVLLVSRGGGSYEDLFCFNDESIIRALAACKIPTISAIGHEIDFTLCDFVADFRAPTPSAAAEVLSSAWAESFQTAKTLTERLKGAILRNLKLKHQQMHWIAARLTNPRDKLNQQAQRIDELMVRLERSVKVRLDRSKAEWNRCCGQLDALSPLRVLERGYALVLSEDQKIIRSFAATEANAYETATIQWHDGKKKIWFEKQK